MNLELEQKVAWVAGGSQGIGRAIAEALAAEGARVALGARSRAGLEAAVAALRAEGREAVAHPLDLADPDAVTRWAAACTQSLGPAQILVVNSGGPPPGGHDTLGAEDWRRAADLLLHGAVALVGAALPAMKAAGWGRVLFVTSLSVRQPIDGLMLSNSLRAAVQGYARTLANEVAAMGITVNCVGPGYTRTERLVSLARAQAERLGVGEDRVYRDWRAAIPAGRLGEPAEIAAVAAFLAGAPAAYVTGQMITVDGGCVRSLL
jgi:3-oxoacyl-[acyl-carrier protein] reductase